VGFHVINSLNKLIGSTSIFVFISHLGVKFLLELNVDYLYFSKKKIQKVMDYPLLID